MVELQEVIAYFSQLAPTWDDGKMPSPDAIHAILDHARVCEGQDVLDVACGTGVMFPYYLERHVASVTGVDVTPEMARIAGEKFAGEPSVQVICGDVETTKFDRLFDHVIIHNAFPHFVNQARVVEGMRKLLKPGGRFTIAHSSGRKALANYQKENKPVVDRSHISCGRMEIDQLESLFAPWYNVDVAIYDDWIYQVSGTVK